MEHNMKQNHVIFQTEASKKLWKDHWFQEKASFL